MTPISCKAGSLPAVLWQSDHWTGTYGPWAFLVPSGKSSEQSEPLFKEIQMPFIDGIIYSICQALSKWYKNTTSIFIFGRESARGHMNTRELKWFGDFQHFFHLFWSLWCYSSFRWAQNPGVPAEHLSFCSCLCFLCVGLGRSKRAASWVCVYGQLETMHFITNVLSA